MKIRALIDEDFVQYKVPSMFIGMCYCDWKCCHDGGFPEEVCQNHELATAPIHEIDDDDLIRRYLSNDITHAIVFGGLEPLSQLDEIGRFLYKLRNVYHCDDTVVIYTGYTQYEARRALLLGSYGPVIMKFGRYVPGNQPHYDSVLGVKLASDNQYAVTLVPTFDILDL